MAPAQNSVESYDLSGDDRDRRFAAGVLLSVNIFLTLLMLVAPELWFSHGKFPLIPAFAFLRNVPLWVDPILSGTGLVVLLGGSCIAVADCFGRYSTHARLFLMQRRFAFAACLWLGLLMALNQHRIQPWAWQFFLIYSSWTVAARARQALLSVAVITVSLYWHSALSKSDYSFVTSYGQQFVRIIAEAVGIELRWVSQRGMACLAAALPLGEIIAGTGLCFRATRRLSVMLVVVMHAALLLALGPWGLQHRPGVLIWNCFFVFQAMIVFWMWPVSVDPKKRVSVRKVIFTLRKNRTASAYLLLVVSLPFLEPWGWIDHWPGWALYASKSSRATAYVRADMVDRLPKEVRSFVREPEMASEWCHLDVDQWSVMSLGVPIYPQDRFRLAVALEIADRYRLENAIRIEWRSMANRWNGRRDSKTIIGTDEIRVKIEDYWLETQSRNASRRSGSLEGVDDRISGLGLWRVEEVERTGWPGSATRVTRDPRPIPN